MSNLYNLDDIHKKLNDIENKFDDVKYGQKDIKEELVNQRKEQEKILDKLRDIELLIPNHQGMRLVVSEGIIIGGIFLFILINGYNYFIK